MNTSAARKSTTLALTSTDILVFTLRQHVLAPEEQVRGERQHAAPQRERRPAP